MSSPRSCAASAAVCTLTPCLVMISTSSSLLDWAVPGPSAHQRLTAASIVASRSVSVSEERSSLKSGSSVLLAHLMVLLRALGNRALSGSGARAVCSGERSGELSGERISGARSGKASAYAAEGAQAATTQSSAGLIFVKQKDCFTPRGGTRAGPRALGFGRGGLARTRELPATAWRPWRREQPCHRRASKQRSGTFSRPGLLTCRSHALMKALLRRLLCRGTGVRTARRCVSTELGAIEKIQLTSWRRTTRPITR